MIIDKYTNHRCRAVIVIENEGDLGESLEEAIEKALRDASCHLADGKQFAAITTFLEGERHEDNLLKQ